MFLRFNRERMERLHGIGTPVSGRKLLLQFLLWLALLVIVVLLFNSF